MDEYFEVKEQLFTERYCEKGVICIDDFYGNKLFENQNTRYLQFFCREK